MRCKVIGGRGGGCCIFIEENASSASLFKFIPAIYHKKNITSATLYDHIDKTKFDFLMKALMEFYMKTRKYKGSETPLTPYPTPPE